ncbi:MAG: hypothetical protein K5762_07470 [Bacilli bacterium]|nr:hypothetical protein [Bacilli bacterium]
MNAKVSINNRSILLGPILSVTKQPNGLVKINVERIEIDSTGQPKENKLGNIVISMTAEEFNHFKEERR